MELRAARMFPRARKPKALWFLVHEIAQHPLDKPRNTAQIPFALCFWAPSSGLHWIRTTAYSDFSWEWLQQTQRLWSIGSTHPKSESTLEFVLDAITLVTVTSPNQCSTVVCGWDVYLNHKHSWHDRSMMAKVNPMCVSVSWVSDARVSGTSPSHC